MKTKYYILGALAMLCLLGTGYYADAYRKQLEEWNEVAKATFDEALWIEVNKRAKTPIFHYSSERHGTASLNTRMPDSVSVMSCTRAPSSQSSSG